MSKTVKQANPHFQFCNTHPDGLVEKAYAATAVNAVSITISTPWNKVFRLLLEQSHKRCILPGESACVHGMLEASGFFRQPLPKETVRPEEIRAYMQAHCTSGVVALVKTAMYQYNGHMLGILPLQVNGKQIYTIVGHEDRSRYIAEGIWLRWPDGQDHSPVPMKRIQLPDAAENPAEQTGPQSHHSFLFHQENPGNLRVGDCVIRGISSALGISWYEAVDQLGRYGYTTLNIGDVYRKLLKEKGFAHYDTYQPGQKRPTAARFCMELNRRFQNGEPVFAHLGRSHVAALMPIRGEDGLYRYHIMDTWDSSHRLVTEYWVRPVSAPAARETKAEKQLQDAFVPGGLVLHPAFGTGTIQALSGSAGNGTLEILFPEAGLKKLSCQWVAEHCAY